MAANKYLSLIGGKIKEIVATIVSNGAANANQIVALDSTGRLDQSVMPVGISAEIITATASEALSAGAFVNLYNNAGALGCRNANASTNATPAHGFVLNAVAANASATVYLLGQANTALTSLTIGQDYWLSTVAGGVTSTPPSTTGNIVQLVGRAHSTSALVFSSEETIELA